MLIYQQQQWRSAQNKTLLQPCWHAFSYVPDEMGLGFPDTATFEGRRDNLLKPCMTKDAKDTTA